MKADSKKPELEGFWLYCCPCKRCMLSWALSLGIQRAVKLGNSTTKKVIISEWAEFDECYYPDLRTLISSPSPVPISNTPTSPSTGSGMPWFPDDDDVPASHSEREVPIQNEPAVPPIAPAAPNAPPEPPMAPAPPPEPEVERPPIQRHSPHSHIQSCSEALPAPPAAPRAALHRPEPSPGSAHHSPPPEPQNPPPKPRIHCTTHFNAGKQPGGWWKLKSPSPAPKSDDEDDESSWRAVIVCRDSWGCQLEVPEFESGIMCGTPESVIRIMCTDRNH